MSRSKKSVGSAPTAPVPPSVTVRYYRAEEKTRTWEYIRKLDQVHVLGGNSIYLHKSLFYPNDPPLAVDVTITVVPPEATTTTTS
jgi:hypothetical protein